MDATRIARQLAERRLEAEQKKFDVGMSTSTLVFQAAQSRNRDLQAILDYIKSLVDFKAVQEVPLSGGGLGVGAPVGGVAPTTMGTLTPGASQTPARGVPRVDSRRW